MYVMMMTKSVSYVVRLEESMQTEEIVAAVAAGLVGGYAGAKIMEPLSMKLYEWESEESRDLEWWATTRGR